MAKKTEPKSLRFNTVHLQFALTKAGVKKEQELIDGLLAEIYESENPKKKILAKYENDISKIDPKAGDMQEVNKVLHDTLLDKIKKNSIPENKLIILAERNTPHNLGDKNSQPIPATNITYFLSDYDIRLMEDRVKVLEAELKSPPKTATIGVKNWIKVRERELSELKAKLKQ